MNYGPWVLMMCQYRFINCNICTTLEGDVDSGRGYACVGAESMWEVSVPCLQFCREPKTFLKNKVYLKDNDDDDDDDGDNETEFVLY